MKILFVREQWADGDPAKGPSDGSYMIPTALRAGHEADVFHYDDQSVTRLDDRLLVKCLDFAPDVVMFSHLLSWGERNIKKETWAEIRDPEILGRKVVGVWHEGIAPDVVRVADEHAECVDLNLFLDTKDQFLRYTKHPDKCLGLFDPRDPRVFTAGAERDIGVFFNGTLVDRAVRMQGYAALMTPLMFGLAEAGIPVTKIGGRRELFVPEGQMVDMLGRSKICLNFSDAGEFRHYKGRVAEALMCGAMLLEWANDETNSVLTPFKDFVPFDGPQDLRQKAAYYLKNDREREKIAAAGREAALEHLDGREFWKSLFNRLGLDVPT